MIETAFAALGAATARAAARSSFFTIVTPLAHGSFPPNHVRDNAKPLGRTTQPAHLASVRSGGSDGLRTTASHQGTEYRRDSSSEHSSYFFFLAKTTPMTSSRPPTLHNLSISDLVNSQFLDERWFGLHFLDNDFHFLDSRCSWLSKSGCCDLGVRAYLQSLGSRRGACNESLQHDAGHGEADEGGNGPRVALEIACQASKTTEPGNGAFDDPALG